MSDFEALDHQSRMRVIHKQINIQALRDYRHGKHDGKRYGVIHSGNIIHTLISLLVVQVTTYVKA